MATWSADNIDLVAEANEALPSDDWRLSGLGYAYSLAHGVAVKCGSVGWHASRVDRVGYVTITHEWYSGNTVAEAIRRQQLVLVDYVLES